MRADLVERSDLLVHRVGGFGRGAIAAVQIHQSLSLLGGDVILVVELAAAAAVVVVVRRLALHGVVEIQPSRVIVGFLRFEHLALPEDVRVQAEGDGHGDDDQEDEEEDEKQPDDRVRVVIEQGQRPGKQLAIVGERTVRRVRDGLVLHERLERLRWQRGDVAIVRGIQSSGTSVVHGHDAKVKVRGLIERVRGEHLTLLIDGEELIGRREDRVRHSSVLAGVHVRGPHAKQRPIVFCNERERGDRIAPTVGLRADVPNG